MKYKANKLLSFIFALVLMVGLLPISVFATENNYTDDDLSEALEAYKKFAEEAEYHASEGYFTSGGWYFTSFALYDLNQDGVPELFTLGGYRMDYVKIFAFKNGEVELVDCGTNGNVYDNGLVCVGISSFNQYFDCCYYNVGEDLSLNYVFRYREWYVSESKTVYSIGEQAHDENSEKVPYSQIEETLAGIRGDAKPVEIEFHENNAAERSAVFSSGAAEVKSYFEAYLKVLEENRNGILKYNWQENDYGKKLTPIAFVDILGDNTPELLFVAAEPPDYYWATLYIYTYENEFAHQVFSQFIAGGAGGALHYTIFQANENFWIQQTHFSIEGRSVWNTRYEFDKTIESLSPAETYSSAKAYHYSSDYSTQISSYTWKHNESEITESEYNEAITELDNSISSLILKDGITHMSVTTEAPISTYSHESISMTYDEAIAYLIAGQADSQYVYTTETSFVSDYGNPDVTLVNDFRFINTDSHEINLDLALMGVTLSGHVYNGNDAEELLKALGYDSVTTTSRSNKGDNRTFHPVASMGYKCVLDENGNKKNVFAVVVRGTQDLWQDIPTDILDGVFTMFDISRGVVAGELESFITETTGKTIDEIKKEDNYFYFTGHSLGGAVANALSVDSMVMSLCGDNKGHIYTYTFESPHTCVNLWWNNPEEMSNAFNFKNALDWVTDQPAYIGSTTYGKDVLFTPFELRVSLGLIWEVILPEAYWNVFLKIFPDFIDKKLTFNNHHRGNCLAYIIQLGVLVDWWEQVPISIAQSTIDIDSDGLRNQLLNNVKVITAHCPVDVSIYRGSDLVGQIINNEVVESVTQIPMLVVDDSKYAMLPDAEEYRIEITATDSGVMEFSCKDAATGNDAKTFTDVALEAGKTMISTVGGGIETPDVKLYVVDDEGKPIAEIQEDGTEAPIEQIAAVNATAEVLEDATEAAVKQNSKFVILLMGIGSIALIGLVVLFLLKRRNRNKKGGTP